MARNSLIQVRRDTAANWTSVNPTLAAGEMGFETDTGKFKIGTGSTAWTSLLYTTDASDITGTTLASNVVSSSLTSVGTLGSLAVTNAVTAATFAGDATTATTTTAASGVGYMGLPQNSTTTGAYRLLATDAGKHIYSTATRTITIPGNATGGSPQVAFPIGSTIVFVNATGTTLTLSMDGTTTDTCLLSSAGTSMTGGSGSRTLAAFGMATLLKITSTSWIISGNGLT
jgi:hypothetical protein